MSPGANRSVARSTRPTRSDAKSREPRAVLDFINSDALPGGAQGLFRPLPDNLMARDPFQVLADYEAYVACQAQVSARWRDPDAWTRQSILTVARMGRFSSDRAIREYCDQIWHVQPVPTAL